VPKGRARFRLQVMAHHKTHDIVEAVQRLAAATAAAQVEDEALKSGTLSLGALEPQSFSVPAAQHDAASIPTKTVSEKPATFKSDRKIA